MVAEGDHDGKIQLREFIALYARSIDTKQQAGMTDVNNCFAAFGGNPRDGEDKVTADKVHDYVLAEYELDVRHPPARSPAPS